MVFFADQEIKSSLNHLAHFTCWFGSLPSVKLHWFPGSQCVIESVGPRLLGLSVKAWVIQRLGVSMEDSILTHQLTLMHWTGYNRCFCARWLLPCWQATERAVKPPTHATPIPSSALQICQKEEMICTWYVFKTISKFIVFKAVIWKSQTHIKGTY